MGQVSNCLTHFAEMVGLPAESSACAHPIVGLCIPLLLRFAKVHTCADTRAQQTHLVSRAHSEFASVRSRIKQVLTSVYALFSSTDPGRGFRGGLPALLLRLFWDHLRAFEDGQRSVNGLVLTIAPPKVLLTALKTICTRTPPVGPMLVQALVLCHHPYLTGIDSHSHPPCPTKTSKNNKRAIRRWRWLELQNQAGHEADANPDTLSAQLLSTLKTELLEGANGLFADDRTTRIGARRCLAACLQARTRHVHIEKPIGIHTCMQ